MDVVVKSRHCNVSDQFRLYVDEKIDRLEKLDDRVIRVEVEVSAEKNKRQHDRPAEWRSPCAPRDRDPGRGRR
jgi:ribosomal subunit interface protein